MRHGETEWSKSGQHTGRTDIPLTDAGRKRAAQVAPMLTAVTFGLVLCSPLSRARDTAQLAGLTPDGYSDDMLEWDYGVYEGRTTADIRAEGRSRLGHLGRSDSGGERPRRRGGAGQPGANPRPAGGRGGPQRDVGGARALPADSDGNLPGPAGADGRMFGLDAGGVSVLGHERVQPVITGWNISPDGLADR